MIKKLFFITFLFIGIKIFATEYYVSTTGKDTNVGTSEEKAWRTLAFAAKKAKAGDTVWIKAGNYGNEKVTFANNGSETSPISFIGYKSTPGDVEKLYFTYSKGLDLDSQELPLFVGVDRNKNIGFNLGNRSYIEIKNVQLSNYRYAIDGHSGSNNLTLSNVLIKSAGGNISEGYGLRFLDPKSKNIKISKSIVINATMAAIVVYGDNNSILDCKTYADENDSKLRGGLTMDYHVGIMGSNNLVSGHYAEHVGNLIHTGHGISLKSYDNKTENNLIEDCDIININGAIELRHRKVKNNIIRNVRIKGKDSRYSGGVHFRDGTSGNIIERVSIEGLKGNNGAFSFYDSTEDGGTKSAASNNIIRNVWVSNCDLGIRIGDGSTKVANHNIFNNIITNCTFYNIKNVIRFYDRSIGGNNVIQNTIISNSKNHYYASESPRGWLEKSNNYINNNFNKPSDNGNISKSAGFVDESKNNFNLKPTSSCIDVGIETNIVTEDFLGTPRPQGNGIDIGAYEYKEAVTSQVNAGEDKNICVGQSVELVAEGGDVFTWSTGETAKSITVQPTETTEYTVSNGDNSDSVIVIVNQLPVVDLGRDIKIIKGESVTLNAPDGFTSYSWSTGESTRSITVTPQEQSIYSVVITNANGCSSEDSIVVIVQERQVQQANSSETPITVSGNQTICIGDSVTLEANGADSYLWSDGSVSNSIEVSPSVTTNYSLLVKKDGVIKTFNIVVYIGSDCFKEEEQEIKLYPNPTAGELNVNLKGYQSDNSGNQLNMYLMTVNGNVLKKVTIDKRNENFILTRKFDLSAYSKGAYFFKVQNGDKTETKKIVLR